MQKDLTIVAVDTAYHALTKRAIEQAVRVTGSEKVLVFSDQDFMPGSQFVKIDSVDQVGYNRVMFKEVAPYIETDHWMCVQYDGMPIDGDMWSDDYTAVDYIGAPWPWGPENRRVGNGGFSIRSRRLMELCLNPELVFNPPGFGENNYMEDTHICIMYRNYLESQGMQFADVATASRFSAEIPGGRFNTYGFHGTLCLPYYLDDDHLEFYINNMTERQFRSDFQARIAFGLYGAERWDHLELIMDRALSLVPDFKERLLVQLPKEKNYFPNLTVEDLENLFVNY
jgi:Protein of unknown function (DUF5672)